MKKRDLKRHLNLYSIFKKRCTTINHAFASAISYYDNYNEAEIDRAIKFLNQNPNGELKCVYCKKNAETWDHLEALVNKGMFTGYVHQLGNLVPCCKKCNSSKGRKNYLAFINGLPANEDEKHTMLSLLNTYKNEFNNNTVDIQSEEYNEITKKYYEIKSQILELMKKADIEAEKIRESLKNKNNA